MSANLTSPTLETRELPGRRPAVSALVLRQGEDGVWGFDNFGAADGVLVKDADGFIGIQGSVHGSGRIRSLEGQLVFFNLPLPE